MTKTASETASYEFTTLTVRRPPGPARPDQHANPPPSPPRHQAIPGVIEYEGARIQLLDLPGIVEGASQGRGRGRQVVSVAKTADLILMMVDATKQTQQKALLELELEAVGIRLNKKRPDVTVKTRPTGGITVRPPFGKGGRIGELIPPTPYLVLADQRDVQADTDRRQDDPDDPPVIQEYVKRVVRAAACAVRAGQKAHRSTFTSFALAVHNCDVMIREDIDEDQLIDILIGNRKYVPCLYVRSAPPPPFFPSIEGGLPELTLLPLPPPLL